MTEYSRPATLDDLKMLLRSLNAHGVEYFLVGGYALAAHGYPRATADIDVVVPATRQAGRKIKDALMVLPDQVAKEIAVEWFEEGENIRVADARSGWYSGSDDYPRRVVVDQANDAGKRCSGSTRHRTRLSRAA